MVQFTERRVQVNERSVDVWVRVKGKLESMSVKLFGFMGGDGRRAQGVAANEGVPDEVVKGLFFGCNGVEEGESVGEVTRRGNGTEVYEFALCEGCVVEASFDEEGVDLLQSVDVVAFQEEVDKRVIFEKLVGRIRAGKKVKNGR
ncbi:hypothetical protein SESBI_19955 [Sesbania bispinosa]|nr:hypothetical protein SESBI_19955 [Sesbania bispinosa]